MSNFPINTIIEDSLEGESGYDAILFVATPTQTPSTSGSKLQPIIEKGIQIDPNLKNEVGILALPDGWKASRLIYAPIEILDPEYDDGRSLQEAAKKGVERFIKAGLRRILVFLETDQTYRFPELITILGVFEALYIPIQVREANPNVQKVDLMGVYIANARLTAADNLLWAKALEGGRIIARDIGGADPERMTPKKIVEYVKKQFRKTTVKIKVVDDTEVFLKEYPLFAAVNRSAGDVERHRGCIMYLEYESPDPVETTMFLVGKGVTYDTGGADIKTGGAMCSMSRDKCGAAAVAGFMKIIADFSPANFKVVVALCLVRNSIGSNCYVADELITSRSGATVRVGNTDAEGRMIMADVLCKMKEMAIDAVNPHLFTVATLTGHAVLSVGKGYSIVMDNGPAREAGTALKIQNDAQLMAEPVEISRIRREDFAFHKGKAEGDDINQSNNAPSVRTNRGHQGPAAFLIMASGLDKHGTGSAKPLKYTHLDIAASAGDFPDPPTGAPILGLTHTFVIIEANKVQSAGGRIYTK